MASYNRVILIGNLTRDPEVRFASGNNAICKFGLAVSRNYTTRDGEKREETTFVDIDAFGKVGEILGKYLSKGRPVMIEGRLQLDTWENKEGEKRSKLKVVCENFQFLGSGRGGDEEGSGGGGYTRSSPPPRESSSRSGGGPAEDFDDEDIPF
ncbi:single-stranded DNA-binding protein [Puniceicoccus vermicola]|uniref:Single-stranded DNA-binding protein n=1 Tax=Puniceicoccus vermicola TaxID=388746 RepID=A0A7X1AYM1_9BACT|nr:single-stranded DNA-binding protein [Puniceicoccus vermicola]MBC2602396.1 single-stranded DNA-binding protein [Puniceicoccus vermicola]